MGKVVLLASGGLDSTTVAYWLHERAICFIPIFYDYGQHCAETEWRTLNTIFTAAGFDAPQRINLSDVFRRLYVKNDK